MRRTIRGRGARGFFDAEPNVDPYPGADLGGSRQDFANGRNVLRSEGYRVRYVPPTPGGWLSLRGSSE